MHIGGILALLFLGLRSVSLLVLLGVLSRRYRLKLKPRDYQVEAARWALSREGAVLSLPTGTGKTLIAVLWAKELLERGVVKRVLVLEPTRILVEQTASYFEKVMGAKTRAIHGVLPKEKRRKIWFEAEIAVATPETALSDVDSIIEAGFDAVVVDECHHTTGRDAYAEFMRKTRDLFKRRLGLSAYIPSSRRREIEEHIGEIRYWSWSDPRIRNYVPAWIGEVYEAELNEAEKKVLARLEELRNLFTGRERGLIQTGIRWLVRDGALALKESLSKPTLLAELLKDVKPLLDDPRVRPAHKLDALIRILRDHEDFTKAIVFVDRVIVAEYIVERLRDYNPVAIYGKAKMREDVRRVLEKAKNPKVRLVVATSAGEEGLDLPEGDLLVVWSNVASPLRFIQRHGRILRATGRRGPPKYVAYIITPDTVDVDSFVDSIELARRAGVDVPVDPEVVERLWRKTTRSRILSILEGRPMPIEWIREATGMPLDILRNNISKLLRHGDLVYIYTHLGKTYALPEDIEILYEEYSEYLSPDPELQGKIRANTNGEERAVTGTYDKVLKRLTKILEKKKHITRLQASFQIPLPGGALKLVNLHYTYLIDTEEKLELALRNAYSVNQYAKYI